MHTGFPDIAAVFRHLSPARVAKPRKAPPARPPFPGCMLGSEGLWNGMKGWLIGISSSCEGALGRSRKNDGSRIENNILKYENHCEIMWGTSLFMSMLWMHVPYYFVDACSVLLVVLPARRQRWNGRRRIERHSQIRRWHSFSADCELERFRKHGDWDVVLTSAITVRLSCGAMPGSCFASLLFP